MAYKKSILLLIYIVASSLFLKAQLNHFIYLQTESKQPFYAKLDKKIMSSSASGYLIIPKLKEGIYNIGIGFPKQEGSEQAYNCTINNKDVGYLIKNFGEKGWALFNFQTLDVTMAATKEKEMATTAEKTNEFSNMLFEVTNDLSVKKVEKASVPAKENQSAKQEEKPAAQQSFAKSAITKKLTVHTSGGIEITYIDSNEGKQDTIKILIPAETKAEPVNVAPEEKIIEQAKQAEEKIIKEEAKQEINQTEKAKEEDGGASKKFLPIQMKTSGSTDKSEAGKAKEVPMPNSNCQAYAAEDDFLKLRKKMANSDTDDEMLSVAQKFLKAKCYTTQQIKNLSVLLLKDEGKYRFFDLAYRFVSDSSNFSILQSQLTEEYYISRFKVMIGH